MRDIDLKASGEDSVMEAKKGSVAERENMVNCQEAREFSYDRRKN